MTSEFIDCKLPVATGKAVIAGLPRDDWKVVRTRGTNYYFRHPARPGLVRVPYLSRDLCPDTMKYVLQQTGYSAPELKALL